MGHKHTPGPWNLYVKGDPFPVVQRGNAGGFQVRGFDKEDALADARLISAAPDLLEAAMALGSMPEGYCFCSSDRVGDDSKEHEPECGDLRAVIAKATGDA